MNTKEKEFIVALFGKTYKIPADEVAAKLFQKEADGTTETFIDTALDEALKWDVSRIATINTEKQTMFDNGYKKAQKESLEKFEKDTKDKYGVTSDKQGLELIEEVVLARIKAQGGEMDDDKIRKSSVYITAVDALKKEKSDAIAAAEDKYKNLEQSITQKEISSEIRKAAKDLILASEPVLPEGKLPDGRLKADIQVEKLIDELLADHKFEKKDGKTFVHNKEGVLMKDIHGHAIEFDSLVKDKTSERWDLKVGEARKGTGNKNEDDDASKKDKKYSGPAINSVSEYEKAIADAKDNEDLKMDITMEWNKNPSNKM